MTPHVPRGLSTGSGRRPGPDEAKVCPHCGATFTKNGRPRPLDAKAWSTRKFCCLDCRIGYQALWGRGSGTFVRRIRNGELSQEEHFAFWRERFTDAEIREIGACLDFLDRDQVAA